MRVKHAGVLMAALVAFSQTGCKKSPNADNRSKVSTGSVDTNVAAGSSIPTNAISRVHWGGIKQLRADTNAATFLKIWDEPSTVALEAHVLDKLARSPWYNASAAQAEPGTETNSPATNRETALLRPLLDDLVNEESFLEIAHPTNSTGVLAFAIRLNDARAAVWDANLSAVLESLTGTKVSRSSGQKILWQLRTDPSKGGVARQVEFARAGEWTLVGLGTDKNSMLQELLSEAQKGGIPYAKNSKLWLEANLDVPAIAKGLSLNSRLGENFPLINLSLTGENGENVLTRGEVTFSKPPLGDLDAWNIPTNMIQQPFLGFTAARGIAPLLQKLSLFSQFPTEDVPRQLYVWDRPGPFHLFFALQSDHPANAVSLLSQQITPKVNPLIRWDYGTIILDTNTSSLTWTNLPFATPFLQPSTNDLGFLFGGFGPYITAKTNPMPPEILLHFNDTTNLVYFDWEQTGERGVHPRYLDDVYRMVFDRHGPRLAWTPSFPFFENNLTNLGVAITEIKKLDSVRLSFARRSTIGLTGLELDLLANWIELPEFPRGLDHFMATNPAPVVRRTRLSQIKTNSEAGPKQQ